MITRYTNKATYTEPLCIVTIVRGEERLHKPIPSRWDEFAVLVDVQTSWGEGELRKTAKGWTYVVDDPNAKERRYATG